MFLSSKNSNTTCVYVNLSAKKIVTISKSEAETIIEKLPHMSHALCRRWRYEFLILEKHRLAICIDTDASSKIIQNIELFLAILGFIPISMKKKIGKI